MSIQSWRAKFYPIPARVVGRGHIDKLEHSIRKWAGLRPANLDAHECFVFNRTVREMARRDSRSWLDIDVESCALCWAYLPEETSAGGRDHKSCPKCPLKQTLGHPCDVDTDITKAPYTIWVDTKNPEPMLEALCASLLRVSPKYAKYVTENVKRGTSTDFIVADVLSKGK